MKFFVSSTISLVLFGLCLISGLDAPLVYADFTIGTPTNLGPPVNSSADEIFARMSADGLELYFSEWAVFRPGGEGGSDIWVATRQTTSDVWGDPCNLGPPVNSSSHEDAPSITADGLTLFFGSYRSGGFGEEDLWVTSRATIDDPWGEPLNLGPTVNSSGDDMQPSVSANGLELYFYSQQSGGYGSWDLCMVMRPTTEDPWGEPVNLGPTVGTNR